MTDLRFKIILLLFYFSYGYFILFSYFSFVYKRNCLSKLQYTSGPSILITVVCRLLFYLCFSVFRVRLLPSIYSSTEEYLFYFYYLSTLVQSASSTSACVSVSTYFTINELKNKQKGYLTWVRIPLRAVSGPSAADRRSWTAAQTVQARGMPRGMPRCREASLGCRDAVCLTATELERRDHQDPSDYPRWHSRWLASCLSWENT